MHELSIASAVVNTAARHADGRAVALVTVRTGALRQVVPESLDFYWGIVTRGTLCEGAALEQQLVPARARCAPCASEWELSDPVFRCPRCGGAEITVVAGEELEVESIEIAEEAPCIA